jgi:hypothetical protein
MDDADYAQQRSDATCQAARYRPPERTHCSDCGDLLEPHCRPYGRCVPCQTQRELALRM